MASTYSSNLRLEKMATGENRSTWGTKANTVFELIEDAISGVDTITLAGAAYTLSTNNGAADEARHAALIVDGSAALDQNGAITIPTVAKIYIIKNDVDSGTSKLTVSNGSDSAVIDAGSWGIIVTDGTNVYSLAETLNISANTIYASSATGTLKLYANTMPTSGGGVADAAQLVLYASSHASAAGDIQMSRKSNAGTLYLWDESAAKHFWSTATSNVMSLTGTTLALPTTTNEGTFSLTGATNGSTMTLGTRYSSRDATTENHHYRFYNPNGLVGSIATALSTTIYATSSDERLKTNFGSFDSGALIDAINTYRFDWKTGGSGYGVKAQEAAEVFPDAISVGEGEPGQEDFVPWSADYSKFVPLLLAEMKALRARVAQLEAGQ